MFAEVIHMDWNYQVGNFICELRREKGLTQKQLGDMLGVTNKAVSKWENGSAIPRIQLLPKLAEILECSQEELFLGVKQQKAAGDPSNETDTAHREYLSVVKRCDCCQHRIRLLKKGMKCDACGAALRLTPKSTAIAGAVSVVLGIAVAFLCRYVSLALTLEVFAGGFPTKEEALMHAELLAHFPHIRLTALFAVGFIYMLGIFIFAVLWYLLVNRLLLKRLSFRIIRYPHAEDGKIIF